MRCLPAEKLPLARGRCLHDWHAEVVAIRAFNHYLLQECRRLADDHAAPSDIIQFRPESQRSPSEHQQFAIRDDVNLYLFCSEAPCGDVSMELTMQAQDDASPWTSQSQSDVDGMLQSGRGHFAELGVVRRKPARADAPPTLSKSCSDKLALKQCTSLLSSITSLFVHPENAYLHELIVPHDQLVSTAVGRAFGSTGRMSAILKGERSFSTWKGGYTFKPFHVSVHGAHFDFSRQRARDSEKTKGSNIAAVWTPGTMEVLIGGTKQGNKQFSTHGRSSLSRICFWDMAEHLASAMDDPDLRQALQREQDYRDLKQSQLLHERRSVKSHVRAEALRPWALNRRDDTFQWDV